MPDIGLDPDAEDLRQELARLAAERDAYQQELFETERHSAWLSIERQMLNDRCREIEARYQEIEARCREVEAQRREIEARSREIEEKFLQSTSWRVTAPLRALSRLRAKREAGR